MTIAQQGCHHQVNHIVLPYYNAANCFSYALHGLAEAAHVGTFFEN
jgi:hypothetical protein